MNQKPVEVKISKLNDADYNPRTISDDEMAALRQSMMQHGMATAVTVRKKGMTIIGGHQRVQALRDMKTMAEKDELFFQIGSRKKTIKPVDVPSTVWAFVLDISEDKAKRLNVALNRVGGEFDEYKLGTLFESLKNMDEHLSLGMGFELTEVDALKGLVNKSIEQQAKELEQQAASISQFGRSITLSIEFETLEQRDKAKVLFKLMTEGKKPGAYLLKLIQKEARRLKIKA